MKDKRIKRQTTDWEKNLQKNDIYKNICKKPYLIKICIQIKQGTLKTQQ